MSTYDLFKIPDCSLGIVLDDDVAAISIVNGTTTPKFMAAISLEGCASVWDKADVLFRNLSALVSQNEGLKIEHAAVVGTSQIFTSIVAYQIRMLFDVRPTMDRLSPQTETQQKLTEKYLQQLSVEGEFTLPDQGVDQVILSYKLACEGSI